MGYRRLMIALVLCLWILAAPLTLMCSSHCGNMGTACASLCAPTPGVLSTLPRLTLLAHAPVSMHALSPPLTPSVQVPTPPPKDLSLFA